MSWSSSTAPAWAIASTISTPGMTGCPGKCPAKNGSLIVTFLRATIRFPASISSDAVHEQERIAVRNASEDRPDVHHRSPSRSSRPSRRVDALPSECTSLRSSRELPDLATVRFHLRWSTAGIPATNDRSRQDRRERPTSRRRRPRRRSQMTRGSALSREGHARSDRGRFPRSPTWAAKRPAGPIWTPWADHHEVVDLASRARCGSSPSDARSTPLFAPISTSSSTTTRPTCGIFRDVPTRSRSRSRRLQARHRRGEGNGLRRGFPDRARPAARSRYRLQSRNRRRRRRRLRSSPDPPTSRRPPAPRRARSRRPVRVGRLGRRAHRSTRRACEVVRGGTT